MNLRRGLLRAWAVVSILWVGVWVVPSLFILSPEERLGIGVLAFVPPLVVLIAGYVVAWVIAGFRRS